MALLLVISDPPLWALEAINAISETNEIIENPVGNNLKVARASETGENVRVPKRLGEVCSPTRLFARALPATLDFALLPSAYDMSGV
jgi:hypothetical protein